MKEKKTFKQIRTEMGLTTNYVADKLGISAEALRRRERKEVKWKVSEALALCEMYHVNLNNVEV